MTIPREKQFRRLFLPHLLSVKDDKVAKRDTAESRQEKMRRCTCKNASTTLEKLFSQIQEGETGINQRRCTRFRWCYISLEDVRV